MEVVESEGFHQGRREEDERERCGDGKANPKKSKRVGKERAKVQTPRNTLSFRAHSALQSGNGREGDHSADVSVIKSTWRFWHLSFATGQRLFFGCEIYLMRKKSKLGILFGGIFPF